MRREVLKNKSAYICGPLTELPKRQRENIKRFYEQIADLCQGVTGTRAFVPHEHYDPVKNPNPTPKEVYKVEYHQISKSTSCLIAVTIAPSWGGGMEVQMANEKKIPVILLCLREKLDKRKISRLLRGGDAVKAIISYNTKEEALVELEIVLRKILGIK